jgi:hypothetical protein
MRTASDRTACRGMQAGAEALITSSCIGVKVRNYTRRRRRLALRSRVAVPAWRRRQRKRFLQKSAERGIVHGVVSGRLDLWTPVHPRAEAMG